MWTRNRTNDRLRPIKFFRISLISLSAPEIEEKLVRLDQEVKKFKEELFRICWYMRGGININDLLYTYSFEDRDAIYNIISENIEATKEAGMPLL